MTETQTTPTERQDAAASSATRLRHAADELNAALTEADAQGLAFEAHYNDGERYYGDMGPSARQFHLGKITLTRAL